MTRVQLDLSGVPETLILPLWGRASDARAPVPILADVGAAALIDSLDVDLSRVSDKLSDYSSLYWARRALLLDGAVRAFAARRRGGTVVNVGAGLDTSFSRVDDGALRWYDVDLPEVIALRRALIPDGPRSRSVPGSLLDDDWFDALGVPPGGPAMFLFGGVLFYFDEAQVRATLARLSRRFPGAEIAFDVLSPIGAFFTTRYLRRVGIPSAPIQWTTRAEALRAWPELVDLQALPLFDDLPADASRSLRLRCMIALTDRLPIGQLVRARLAG